jgi:hypothetical protein
MIRELQIDFAGGCAVVMKDGEIELTDCRPFTVAEAEYLIEEVKAYIEYRKCRNDIKKRANDSLEDTAREPFCEKGSPKNDNHCNGNCETGNCKKV